MVEMRAAHNGMHSCAALAFCSDSVFFFFGFLWSLQRGGAGREHPGRPVKGTILLSTLFHTFPVPSIFSGMGVGEKFMSAMGTGSVLLLVLSAGDLLGRLA